jgi:hypothetical protein
MDTLAAGEAMRTTDTAAGPREKGLCLSSAGGVDLPMGHRPLAAALLLLACHRTPLGFIGYLGDAGAAVSHDASEPPDLSPPADAAPDLAPPPDLSLAPDVAAADAEPASPPPQPPSEPVVPGCQPQPEVCNGRDDDCDGKIDEDLAPIPCPNGGFRYCVAGRTSECPRVCEVCRPGSRRVCTISYCTYWGAQTCAADGRSFGLCRESPVPAECQAIAKSKKKSPELERCCIDNGYCCLDEYDLDGDGDRTEMLGRCGAVTCPP